jgi:hypothetical protein
MQSLKTCIARLRKHRFGVRRLPRHAHRLTELLRLGTDDPAPLSKSKAPVAALGRPVDTDPKTSEPADPIPFGHEHLDRRSGAELALDSRDAGGAAARPLPCPAPPAAGALHTTVAFGQTGARTASTLMRVRAPHTLPEMRTMGKGLSSGGSNGSGGSA